MKRRIIIVKGGRIIYDKPVSNIGCLITMKKGGLVVIDVMEKLADYERSQLKLSTKEAETK